MKHYNIQSSEIYEVDLFENDFELRRTVEGMSLYRRGDQVILANKDQYGKLEILLNLNVPKEIKK